MKLIMMLAVILMFTCNYVICEKCQRRVCHLRLYYSSAMRRTLSWANYPLYCTHVILHRAQVTGNQEISLTKIDGLNEVHQVLDIRRQNPQMKLILAIQNKNFADFVKMYTNDEYRNTFIRNIITYLRQKTIDGVKIDVQTVEGGVKEKFTQLIKNLMTAFSAEASSTYRQRLLLSVGIPSDKSFLDKYYDVLEISNYVDMVDLATYSFIDPNDKKAVKEPKHHSPLYSSDKSSTKTIDFMARYVAEKGVRKDKINVGLSFMSSEYIGDDTTRMYTLGSIKFGFQMSCPVIFPELRRFVLQPENGRLSEYFSDRDETFFRIKVFYDDPGTLKEKVKYVKANNYGGVLIYKIDDDDGYNACRQGSYALSKAVYGECSKS